MDSCSPGEKKGPADRASPRARGCPSTSRMEQVPKYDLNCAIVSRFHLRSPRSQNLRQIYQNRLSNQCLRPKHCRIHSMLTVALVPHLPNRDLDGLRSRRSAMARSQSAPLSPNEEKILRHVALGTAARSYGRGSPSSDCVRARRKCCRSIEAHPAGRSTRLKELRTSVTRAATTNAV